MLDVVFANLHWRLLHAIGPGFLSRFVVRGELRADFPADVIERVEERMNKGRFLSSLCLPVNESEWRRARGDHPFRAQAERARSELCVHAVDVDFSSLKVVWLGLSSDARLLRYEVFFPSLGAFVLLSALAILSLALVSAKALVLAVPLVMMVRWARRNTRIALVRTLAELSAVAA